MERDALPLPNLANNEIFIFNSHPVKSFNANTSAANPDAEEASPALVGILFVVLISNPGALQ